MGLVALVALGAAACSSLANDGGNDSSDGADSDDDSSSSSGGSKGLGGAEALGGSDAGGAATGGAGEEPECTKVLEDDFLALSSFSELSADAPRLAQGPGGAFVSVGSTMPTLEAKPVGVVRHFSTGDVEDWAREIPGKSNNDELFGAAFDAAGNVYVVGSTSDALGDGDNAGLIDAFIRRYDSNGNVAWTRQFGTALFDKVRDIAIHGDALYVVGYSDDTEENGWTNAYVKKFELDGDWLWTRDIQSEWVDTLYRVVVNAAGDVYVLGDTGGDLDGPLAGAQDAFVRKYNASGDVVWTRQFGGPDFETPTGLVLDADGNVVIVGRGNDFDGGFWGFAAKYDASGTRAWFRSDFSDLTSVGGVDVDADGNVYFATYSSASSQTSAASGVRKLSPEGADVSSHVLSSKPPASDVLVVDVDEFYFTGSTFLAHTRLVCSQDD